MYYCLIICPDYSSSRCCHSKKSAVAFPFHSNKVFYLSIYLHVTWKLKAQHVLKQVGANAPSEGAREKGKVTVCAAPAVLVRATQFSMIQAHNLIDVILPWATLAAGNVCLPVSVPICVCFFGQPCVQKHARPYPPVCVRVCVCSFVGERSSRFHSPEC